MKKEPLSVALVSDFFFPSLGGVEMQIKQLSMILRDRIDKVIVITHCYPPQYCGVCWIDGVKTYYLPLPVITTNIGFPNFLTDYPQAKRILLEQKIEVIHTHQSTSPLGIAFGMQGYHLGMRVVHTQHSLFEFKKIDGIIYPWTIRPVHQLYDKFICVSRATRNNLLIRNKQKCSKSIVIPNSVETSFISRMSQHQQDNKIRVVLVSRMVFRRGIDILIQLIPILCERNPDIIVQLVGDGAKMKPLREMVRIKHLQNQTVIHGGLPNKLALQVVKKSQIFLNTALTESFGIALVEAASLGLNVISGDVGGVVEVLPPEYLHIVQLTMQSFLRKIEEVATKIRNQRKTKKEGGSNLTIRNNLNLYPKQKIFERVIDVYKQVLVQKKQSKIINLFGLLFFKGNLISLLVLFFLLSYTLWDIFQTVKNKVSCLFKLEKGVLKRTLVE